MPLPTPEELLAAAEQQVEALGSKPYPVLICTACFRLTGWVGANGACANCIRTTREHADPNRLGLATPHLEPLRDQVSFLRRAKRALGVGSDRDRAREWLSKVEPDETGPIAPEEGWTIEWPIKSEREAPEGPHRLVLFDVQSFRFEYGAWRPAATSSGGKPRTLTPRDFEASLEIAALAKAWNDYVAQVTEHNSRVWRAEAERRESGERAADERRLADELERGTSGLLD